MKKGVQKFHYPRYENLHSTNQPLIVVGHSISATGIVTTKSLLSLYQALVRLQ